MSLLGDHRGGAPAFRVHGDGVVDPPYHKNVLVPFGEYLPLGDIFPPLERAWRRGRNQPGSAQPVFDSTAGKLSFLICYEAIKSTYVRAVANRSIDLLVNLTYDGWFGDTSCPHLHLAAAALQSAPRAKADSIYRARGDWFPWTCIAVLAVIAILTLATRPVRSPE